MDCGCLIAGIMSTNTAEGMDVCLLCLLCCVGSSLCDRLITCAGESCVCVWSRNLNSEAAQAVLGLLHNSKKTSFFHKCPHLFHIFITSHHTVMAKSFVIFHILAFLWSLLTPFTHLSSSVRCLSLYVLHNKLKVLLAVFVTFTINLMFAWCLNYNQEWQQSVDAVYKNCFYYLQQRSHNGSCFDMWLGKLQQKLVYTYLLWWSMVKIRSCSCSLII